MKNYTIYTLVNPIDNSIYYVGNTSNVKQRYDDHLRPRNSTKEKNEITKKIRSSGLKPIIREICCTNDRKEALTIEQSLAQDLISAGHNILCGKLGNKPSADLLMRMSISRKGVIPLAAMKGQNEARKKPGYVDKTMVGVKKYVDAKKIKVKDDLGVEFSSIREAARHHGIQHSSVRNVLSGKRNQVQGRRFFYV